MRVRKYQARTWEAALAAVKADLGARAVVLFTRSFRKGGLLGVGGREIIEITATDDASVVQRYLGVPPPPAPLIVGPEPGASATGGGRRRPLAAVPGACFPPPGEPPAQLQRVARRYAQLLRGKLDELAAREQGAAAGAAPAGAGRNAPPGEPAGGRDESRPDAPGGVRAPTGGPLADWPPRKLHESLAEPTMPAEAAAPPPAARAWAERAAAPTLPQPRETTRSAPAFESAAGPAPAPAQGQAPHTPPAAHADLLPVAHWGVAAYAASAEGQGVRDKGQGEASGFGLRAPNGEGDAAHPLPERSGGWEPSSMPVPVPLPVPDSLLPPAGHGHGHGVPQSALRTPHSAIHAGTGTGTEREITTPQSDAPPRLRPTTERFAAEVVALHREVTDVVERRVEPALTHLPAWVHEEYRRLQGLAFPDDVARGLARRLHARYPAETAPPAPVRDEALIELAARRLPVSPEPPPGDGRPRRIAVLGPPGAGKSTLAAHLARRLAARGDAVGLLSLDTDHLTVRACLHEPHRAPPALHLVARTPQELRERLADLESCAVIVADTPGLGARDQDRRRRLERLWDVLAPDEAHLVLSATGHPRSLRAAAAHLDALRPGRLALTKLDATVHPGYLFEVIEALRLPLSYFAAGREPEAVSAARPETLARAMLLGEWPGEDGRTAEGENEPEA